MEKELRVFGVKNIEVRQATDEPPVIVGYPAIYNSRSENLGGFVEVIEPGFFDEVLGPEEDTRAVQNHDPNYVLGRKRAGTLFIEDTNDGLKVMVIPPDTQYARDLITLMDRGDVDQMSFAFAVKKGGDSWGRMEDGTPLRTLKRGGCARLSDVSIVTYPAYPETSAAVRAEARALSDDDTLTDGAGQADGESDDKRAGGRQALNAAKLKLARAKGK